MPARPEIDGRSYPACRDDFAALGEARDRAIAINRCTSLIDEYYKTHMLPYREAMIAYQQQLSASYQANVAHNSAVPVKQREEFYRRMLAEHKASTPEGANQATYRAIEARYTADRAYLADRYCFHTGCNGYPVPPKEKTTVRKGQVRLGFGTAVQVGGSDAPPAKCGRTRGPATVAGGLAGGIAGDAVGLNGLGGIMSGLLGAVLAGEIACQLDEKEKKVAADAALALAKKDSVGATSTWISPTREGVSGSSTITERETQPNGTRCLSIVDIVIIDGEETRVVKRLCRDRAGEPYRVKP